MRASVIAAFPALLASTNGAQIAWEHAGVVTSTGEKAIDACFHGTDTLQKPGDFTLEFEVKFDDFRASFPNGRYHLIIASTSLESNDHSQKGWEVYTQNTASTKSPHGIVGGGEAIVFRVLTSDMWNRWHQGEIYVTPHANGWHHYVFTWDSAEGKVRGFVDGRIQKLQTEGISQSECNTARKLPNKAGNGYSPATPSDPKGTRGKFCTEFTQNIGALNAASIIGQLRNLKYYNSREDPTSPAFNPKTCAVLDPPKPTAPPTTDTPTQSAKETGFTQKGGVNGDPFVIDQDGKKVQFFMPIGMEMLLIACDTMQLYGRAFGSHIPGDHQQWFDRFRIVNDDKDHVVVTVAKNMTGEADGADIDLHSNLVQPVVILNVQVQGHRLSKTGALATDDSCLITVWKTSDGETVQWSCGDSVLQVKTAVAQKFNDKGKQEMYTHLDLRFVELRTADCKAGIIAEIWGITPMSVETVNMLMPPKPKQ